MTVSGETPPDPVGRWPTNTGATLAIVDVVGDRHGELVPTLTELFRRAFSQYPASEEVLLADARLPAQRRGIVVHQWVVLLDARPVGFMLFDSNLVRRVAVARYLFLEVNAVNVSVQSRRLLTWLYHQAIDTLRIDLGSDDVLGLVGESLDRGRSAVFRWIGMRTLPVEYYEPSDGEQWAGPGSDINALELMWLAPDGVDPAETQALAVRAGTAAFLLDRYGFDPSLPWVASAVGDEAQRSRPVRSGAVSPDGGVA
jgi:hypothetical protein